MSKARELCFKRTGWGTTRFIIRLVSEVSQAHVPWRTSCTISPQVPRESPEALPSNCMFLKSKRKAQTKDTPADTENSGKVIQVPDVKPHSLPFRSSQETPPECLALEKLMIQLDAECQVNRHKNHPKGGNSTQPMLELRCVILGYGFWP